MMLKDSIHLTPIQFEQESVLKKFSAVTILTRLFQNKLYNYRKIENHSSSGHLIISRNGQTEF